MTKDSRFKNGTTTRTTRTPLTTITTRTLKVQKKTRLYKIKKAFSRFIKNIKGRSKVKYTKCEATIKGYIENSKGMQNMIDIFEQISNEPIENKIIDDEIKELKSLGFICKYNRTKFCHNMEKNQNKPLIRQLCKINVSLAMTEAVAKGYPGFLWFKTDNIDTIFPYLTQILNYQGGISKYFKVNYTRTYLENYNVYLELPSYIINKYNLKCVNNIWHYKHSSYFRELTENITKIDESTQYENVNENKNNENKNNENKNNENKNNEKYYTFSKELKERVFDEDYDSKIYESKEYELKEYKYNDFENHRDLNQLDNHKYDEYGYDEEYDVEYDDDYLNIPRCDPKYSNIFTGNKNKYFDEEKLNKYITEITHDAIHKLEKYCLNHIEKCQDRKMQLFMENDEYSVDESDIIEQTDIKYDTDSDESTDSELNDENSVEKSTNSENTDNNEINIEINEDKLKEIAQETDTTEQIKNIKLNYDDDEDTVVVLRHEYESDDYEKI